MWQDKKKRKDYSIKRRELLGRFMTKKLFGWLNKKYNKEY